MLCTRLRLFQARTSLEEVAYFFFFFFFLLLSASCQKKLAVAKVEW